MKILGAKIRLITDTILYFDEIGIGIGYNVDDFIRDLKKEYGVYNRRVICRDINGHYDEIVLRNGMFHHFQPLANGDEIIDTIKTYFEDDTR